MKSSTKAVVSFLILGLMGVAVYLSSLRTLEFFRFEKVNASLKKPVPVKPKNLRERNQQMASVSFEEEFTFFDTLDDPSMSKFVGLGGEVVGGEPDDPDPPNTPSNPSGVGAEPVPSSRKPGVGDNPVPGPVAATPANPREDSPAGFALQVGSFRDIEKARALKEKLSAKGYPVYLLAARIQEKGDVWHRVFLGRYADREIALKTVDRIKAGESLDSVVVWQDTNRR